MPRQEADLAGGWGHLRRIKAGVLSHIWWQQHVWAEAAGKDLTILVGGSTVPCTAVESPQRWQQPAIAVQWSCRTRGVSLEKSRDLEMRSHVMHKGAMPSSVHWTRCAGAGPGSLGGRGRRQVVTACMVAAGSRASSVRDAGAWRWCT